MAPVLTVCPYCPAQRQVGESAWNDVDGGAFILRGEWTDVAQGLQCRVRHFVYDGDAVGAGGRTPDGTEIEFRPAPKD